MALCVYLNFHVLAKVASGCRSYGQTKGEVLLMLVICGVVEHNETTQHAAHRC